MDELWKNPINVNALDALDVAELLGVNKNTVYRLVKENRLSSYHVGRKLRFTIQDVDGFIEHERNGGSVVYVDSSHRTGSKNDESTRSGDIPEQTGSQPDSAQLLELLEPETRVKFAIAGKDAIMDTLIWHLSEFGIGATSEKREGYSALVELYLGKVQAAVIDLWDGPTDTCNIPFVKRLMPGTPCIMFSLARMNVGFLVPRGNPGNVRKWSDLVRDDIRIANREKGSSSRILLDGHLVMLEANHSQVRGYDRELYSQLSLGAFIAKGGAEVGVGSEGVYHLVDGLDFLPQQQVELALVIRKTQESLVLIKLIRSLLRSDNFKASLPKTPGCDYSRLGQVVYEV